MPQIGQRIRVDGRTVHVLEEGSGDPVLLLHGCGSLAEEILAAFTGRCEGRRLLAVDRPGYGGSDPLPDRESGPDAQADWLAAVMEALDLPSAIIVGHSYGAATALFLAGRHSERVEGLMLVAPFCRPTPHAAMPLLHLAIAPVIGSFIRHAVIAPLGPIIGPGRMAAAHRPNPVPDYLSTFPYEIAAAPVAVTTMAAELLAFNRATTGFGEVAGALTMPVTVIAGTEDEIAPPRWHSDWLAELVPGIDVVTIEGTGHAPHHVDRDAAAEALHLLARRARTDRYSQPSTNRSPSVTNLETP